MKTLTNYKGETLYCVILHELFEPDNNTPKSVTTMKFVWADDEKMSTEYCEGLFGIKNGITDQSGYANCVDATVEYYPVNPDPTYSKSIMEEW